jgi:uncharacterized phage infection (PIP) family protein YhgE
MTNPQNKKSTVNNYFYLIILSHFNNCKQKKKELREQNYNLATQAEKERKLGENLDLPQYERDKHKQVSEELKAKALQVKEEYRRVTELTESLDRKLDNLDSRSDSPSDSESDF